MLLWSSRISTEATVLGSGSLRSFLRMSDPNAGVFLEPTGNHPYTVCDTWNHMKPLELKTFFTTWVCKRGPWVDWSICRTSGGVRKTLHGLLGPPTCPVQIAPARSVVVKPRANPGRATRKSTLSTQEIIGPFYQHKWTECTPLSLGNLLSAWATPQSLALIPHLLPHAWKTSKNWLFLQGCTQPILAMIAHQKQSLSDCLSKNKNKNRTKL